jgi:hypothetical protein
MSRDDFVPELKIECCYSYIFRYPNNHYRKFIILTVRNIDKEEALACHARLFSNDTPQKEYPLHWAVTPYTTSRDHAEAIDILPHETRDLDVAFSIGRTYPSTSTREDTSVLVTTETSESYQTAGTVDPRFIVHGTGARPFVWRSDDTYFGDRIEGPKSGAWIALPIALTMPEIAGQARLEPSKYDVEVEIFTINGQGDKCKLTIVRGSS